MVEFGGKKRGVDKWQQTEKAMKENESQESEVHQLRSRVKQLNIELENKNEELELVSSQKDKTSISTKVNNDKIDSQHTERIGMLKMKLQDQESTVRLWE